MKRRATRCMRPAPQPREVEPRKSGEPGQRTHTLDLFRPRPRATSLCHHGDEGATCPNSVSACAVWAVPRPKRVNGHERVVAVCT